MALGARMGRDITAFLKKVGNGRIAGVPKMRNGKDHCLAWQCKGACFPTTCKRRDSHVVLSAQEEDELHAFLEAGCVAISA